MFYHQLCSDYSAFDDTDSSSDEENAEKREKFVGNVIVKKLVRMNEFPLNNLANLSFIYCFSFVA